VSKVEFPTGAPRLRLWLKFLISPEMSGELQPLPPAPKHQKPSTTIPEAPPNVNGFMLEMTELYSRLAKAFFSCDITDHSLMSH